jgi:hypothetical protein
LKEEIYYSSNPIFCPECVSNTISESAGNIGSANGFGFRFGFKKDYCPLCHSYIQNKYLTLFFIPVFKLGSYRTKSISKDYKLSVLTTITEEFISRRVK